MLLLKKSEMKEMNNWRCYDDYINHIINHNLSSEKMQHRTGGGRQIIAYERESLMIACGSVNLVGHS